MVNEHLLCVKDSRDIRAALMEVMPWMLSRSRLNNEMTDQHTIAFTGNGLPGAWIICVWSMLKYLRMFSAPKVTLVQIGEWIIELEYFMEYSNQSILKEVSPGCSLEGLMLKLKLQYFGHLMWRVDSLEKTLMLGGTGAGGEGDDRGWDGWMASPTWWTWVWVNSGSWWWTGKPGVLQFMGPQRVGHDWTELAVYFAGRKGSHLTHGDWIDAAIEKLNCNYASLWYYMCIRVVTVWNNPKNIATDLEGCKHDSSLWQL